MEKDYVQILIDGIEQIVEAKFNSAHNSQVIEAIVVEAPRNNICKINYNSTILSAETNQDHAIGDVVYVNDTVKDNGERLYFVIGKKFAEKDVFIKKADPFADYDRVERISFSEKQNDTMIWTLSKPDKYDIISLGICTDQKTIERFNVSVQTIDGDSYNYTLVGDDFLPYSSDIPEVIRTAKLDVSNITNEIVSITFNAENILPNSFAEVSKLLQDISGTQVASIDCEGELEYTTVNGLSPSGSETLGRTITLNYTYKDSSGFLHQITPLNIHDTGVPEDITIHWQRFNTDLAQWESISTDSVFEYSFGLDPTNSSEKYRVKVYRNMDGTIKECISNVITFINHQIIKEYIKNAKVSFAEDDTRAGVYDYWDLDGLYCYDNELDFLQQRFITINYETDVEINELYRGIKSIVWDVPEGLIVDQDSLLYAPSLNIEDEVDQIADLTTGLTLPYSLDKLGIIEQNNNLKTVMIYCTIAFADHVNRDPLRIEQQITFSKKYAHSSDALLLRFYQGGALQPKILARNNTYLLNMSIYSKTGQYKPMAKWKVSKLVANGNAVGFTEITENPLKISLPNTLEPVYLLIQAEDEDENSYRKIVPLSVAASKDIIFYSGPDYITYDTLGNSPVYNNSAFNLTGAQAEKEWSIHSNLSKIGKPQYSSSMPALTNDATELLPQNNYEKFLDERFNDAGVYEYFYQCWLTYDTNQYIQPLVIQRQKTASALLDSFDGSYKIMTTADQKSVVQSTALMAGTKNSNEEFTGIIAGDIEDTLTENNATTRVQRSGVYGYQDGDITFELNNSGIAKFGKEGSGQIVIDGNAAQLKSANAELISGSVYATNGMIIDLDEGDGGAIHAKHAALTSDGKLYATEGHFSGEVNASSGTIGPVSIQNMNAYEVFADANNISNWVGSNGGTIFYDKANEAICLFNNGKRNEVFLMSTKTFWLQKGYTYEISFDVKYERAAVSGASSETGNIFILQGKKIPYQEALYIVANQETFTHYGPRKFSPSETGYYTIRFDNNNFTAASPTQATGVESKLYVRNICFTESAPSGALLMWNGEKGNGVPSQDDNLIFKVGSKADGIGSELFMRGHIEALSGKIGNMEIAGLESHMEQVPNENLVLNSDVLCADGRLAGASYNWNNNATAEEVKARLITRLEYRYLNLGQGYKNLEDGEKITISFDMVMKVNSVTYNEIYYGSEKYGEINPDRSFSAPQLTIYNSNNKGPVTFDSHTITFNKEGWSKGSTYAKHISITTTARRRKDPNKDDNYIEFYSIYGSGNYFTIHNLKIERGTIETPYSSSETLDHLNLLESSKTLKEVAQNDCKVYDDPMHADLQLLPSSSSTSTTESGEVPKNEPIQESYAPYGFGILKGTNKKIGSTQTTSKDILMFDDIRVEPNTVYTLSFMAKGRGDIQVYFYTPNNEYLRCVAKKTNTTSWGVSGVDGSTAVTLTEEYKKYSISWRVGSLPNIKDGTKCVLFRLFGDNNGYLPATESKIAIIYAPKLEKGPTASEWSEKALPYDESGNYSWKFSPTQGLLMWNGQQGNASTTEDTHLCFKVNNNGVWIKGNGEFTGQVIANGGRIGEWVLRNNGNNLGASLYSGYHGTNFMGLFTNFQGIPDNTGVFADYLKSITVGNSEKKNNWRILIGANQKYNFGVDSEGGLYAASGEIGAWSIDYLASGVSDSRFIGIFRKGNQYSSGMAAVGDGGSVAFWAGCDGGTPWEVQNRGEDWSSKTSFSVTEDGQLTTKNAKIRGGILFDLNESTNELSSGEIGWRQYTVKTQAWAIITPTLFLDMKGPIAVDGKQIMCRLTVKGSVLSNVKYKITYRYKIGHSSTWSETTTKTFDIPQGTSTTFLTKGTGSFANEVELLSFSIYEVASRGDYSISYEGSSATWSSEQGQGGFAVGGSIIPGYNSDVSGALGTAEYAWGSLYCNKMYWPSGDTSAPWTEIGTQTIKIGDTSYKVLTI